MNALKFITAIFGLLKDPKAAGSAATVAVMLGGGGYALHVQAAQIEKNRDQLTRVLIVNEKVLVALASIKESVDDTKKAVEKTSDRVWGLVKEKAKTH